MNRLKSVSQLDSNPSRTRHQQTKSVTETRLHYFRPSARPKGLCMVQLVKLHRLSPEEPKRLGVSYQQQTLSDLCGVPLESLKETVWQQTVTNIHPCYSSIWRMTGSELPSTIFPEIMLAADPGWDKKRTVLNIVFCEALCCRPGYCVRYIGPGGGGGSMEYRVWPLRISLRDWSMGLGVERGGGEGRYWKERCTWI